MWYNLLYGTVRSWKRLAACACIFIPLGITLSGGYGAEPGGFLDVWMMLFNGDSPAPKDPNAQYTLPAMPILIWIVLLLYVGFYARSELNSRSENAILAYRWRSLWWDGQCLWALCNTILFFVVVGLALCVALLLGGKNPFLYAQLVYQIPADGAGFSLWVFVLPVICFAAMVQMQLTLSLLVGAPLATIGMVAFYALCIYFDNPVLVGAGTMLIRNSNLGMGQIPGIILLLCGILFWFVWYFAGRMVIRRIPMIKKGTVE
ncbi:MAG: hypothetical protein H9882_00470 [Candidatus Fournierella pullistercoris]|uniref:Uncharacterized protein n=1 Tax=Candidatus Allofournierella pullistercoris TaxID=2838597 RepID=A0A948T0B0_9FIRM|nr:hypothetical protein [Candidatus Fournierella pullistercoris]